jgi:hypothetical protein
LTATPAAIRQYLTFLQRNGEDVDPSAAFATSVAGHITGGMWLGNGSPYLVFGPDLEPLRDTDAATYLSRHAAMRETLALWAEKQTDEALDAPAEGRTARAVLLHLMGGPGAYLSASVGGASGFSRIATAAERGQVPIADALREVAMMAATLVRRTTPEQRSAIIQRPGNVRTLRKAIRRMLEHDWEHLAELSRRRGGPLQ